MWAGLQRRLDPARERPELGEWVEVKSFDLPYGNSYAVAGNGRDLVYYRLTPAEAELVGLMDGNRTTGDIVVEHLHSSGELDLGSAADLVRLLHEGNFLVEPYVDVAAAIERAIHPETWRTRAGRFTRTLSVEWNGAEAFVVWLYNHGMRALFSTIGAAISILITVLGVAAITSVVASHQFHLTAQKVGVGFLILWCLNLAIIFIHELGHAAMLVHHGKRVKAAGFRIYFGAPSFFIDSSDALLLDRGPRISQAFAGPYFELVAAGVASMALWAFPSVWLAPVLFRFCFLNYIVALENLVPLLELDGYWILSDALQLPDLRPRSLAFMRHDLWAKLRRREHFSASEIGLFLYGTVGVAFTLACFYFAWFFWRRTFGDLISKMWHGGPVGVVLLVLLGLFLGGPLLRALTQLLRAIAARLVAAVRSLRFRAQRKWRIEAAEMLDAQPIFEDLPVDVLNDLAGRVRLRRVGPGSALFRQGDRADAFYVVRGGSFEVIEEDEEGNALRVLRRVGPGESFGEMGLANAAPRNATVRAVRRAEVFLIDKGSFDRLLAQHVSLRAIEPTIQQLGELRDLPAFAHLGPTELNQLAHHGRWVTIPPGRTLMEQGKPGGHFFALASGRVEIIEDGLVVRERGPGEHVGELALLLDRPRMATVRTATPVRAYRIDKRGFDMLVRDAFRRGRLRPNVAVDRRWDH